MRSFEVERLSLPGLRHFSGLGWMAGMILLVSALAAALGQTVSAPIQTNEQSASIHGVVLSGSTARPLARALVQVDGRSVLTAFDGRFAFAGLSSTTTVVRVTKPGFYGGLDSNQTATKSVAVGSPDDIEVRLYPEGLITGTISGSNGDPLAQVQVRALRRVDDEPGTRWSMAGQTNTNADGQFRLPLPGGEYVVETEYMPERFGAHGAILPMLVPAAGSDGGGASGTSSLRLASGSEQHFDLHPPVRPSHGVHIQIDSPASLVDGQSAAQIRVHLANGLVFSAQSRPSDKQGEVVVNLPNGSYLLSASTGARSEGASYGETRVTVADEDVTGVTIHLQKALELKVEVSIDPAATSTSVSSSSLTTGTAAALDPASFSFVQQLGFFLQRTDSGVNLSSGADRVLPGSRSSGAVGLTLLPGRFRLRTAGYSPWFIESATTGGTDLLAQDLVVDGGSSSVPLRLVVNNQAATIKGTTKLGEQAMACFVYLMATSPSTLPVVNALSGSDGSFSRGQIPPGTYRVVASESRLYFDLTSPAVQRQLAPYIKTLTVGNGETGTVDLNAISALELKP